MRKGIEHVIKYVEDDGTQKELKINISFVPNIAIKKYNEIMSIAHNVQKTWDEMNYILADMSAIEKEKADGWKQKKLDLEMKYIEKTNAIRENGDEYFFNKRLELIFLLLKKNGVTDEKFFNSDFWDSCVDPMDIMDFINVAIWKDNPEGKKKVM